MSYPLICNECDAVTGLDRQGDYYSLENAKGWVYDGNWHCPAHDPTQQQGTE